MSDRDRPQRGGRAGRPGRGRGGGRRNRETGRPISQSERMILLNIWYQISDTSRSELLSQLTLRGGNPPPAQRPGAIAPALGEVQPAPLNRRQRVWEREIIRDIPRFSVFGQMTNAERAADSHTSQLLSIVTGVIARGRNLGEPDEIIRNAIEANLDSVEALRSLFSAVPRLGAPGDGDEIIPVPAEDVPPVAAAAAPREHRKWGDLSSSEDEEKSPRSRKKKRKKSSDLAEKPGPKPPPPSDDGGGKPSARPRNRK